MSVLEQLAASAHLLAGMDENTILPPKVRDLLRAALVTIHDDPEKVLTTPAGEVVLDSGLVPQSILELSGKMVAVCKQYHGQGLAAPQIGKGIRLFVLQSTTDRTWYALLNPTMIRHGRDVSVAEEGCLSIPGVRVYIERWKLCEIEAIWWKITPEVYDGTSVPARWSTRRTLNFRGLDARCVQHELDHLDGRLIIHAQKETS